MAQDPQLSKNQEVQNPKRRQHHQTYSDDEEIMSDEIVALPYRRAYEMADKFAATRIGQFIILSADRFLQTIETTSKWSIPKRELKEYLIRPLPWIPFIMMILTLRLARFWISVGALMIGNSPVSARDVVYFLQTRRRKLRSLRLRGVKKMVLRESERTAKKSGFSLSSFKAQMKKIFASAICRPGQHHEPERRIVILRGKEQIYEESDSSQKHAAKRTRTDCDANLTIEEMLNKYASDNTEDDSDFIPNQEDLSREDSSTTSSASNHSTDEGEAILEKNASDHHDSKQNLSNDTSKLNQTVNVIENGNNDEVLIKPTIEVTADESNEHENENTEQQSKTPHENGPSNGVENQEVDVALKFVYTPPSDRIHEKENNLSAIVDAETKRKATPGHESAAEMRPQLKATMNATAAAGSPPDFSAYEAQSEMNFKFSNMPGFQTQSTQNNPNIGSERSATRKHHQYHHHQQHNQANVAGGHSNENLSDSGHGKPNGSGHHQQYRYKGRNRRHHNSEQH